MSTENSTGEFDILLPIAIISTDILSIDLFFVYITHEGNFEYID
jgi:hypothetical protein